jgi:hypothetical protein
MIYSKKRVHSSVPGGFISLEEESTKTRLHGFGYGEHIRLHDEYGNVWRGSAEKCADETVRYTFRNAMGRTISGMASACGVTLRDNRGKIWRGFRD